MVFGLEYEGREMKCMHCGSELVRGTVPFHVDRRGVHVTVDEVPAWVCQQCGEYMLEASEVDYVQNIVRAVENEAAKSAREA